MIEQHVDITSRNGPNSASPVSRRARGNAFRRDHPCMDAPGIREELRNLARRIAKHGYFCLLPDMYYRLGTLRFDFVRRADGMRAAMVAAMNSLTNQLVVDDTAAWLGTDAPRKVAPGPVRCVGYYAR